MFVPRTLSVAHRIWFLLAVFYVMACSGGGCSSCSGCGIDPIPGGFPTDQRIDNAAQVRLTSSGVQFLADNIGDVLASFLPTGLSFDLPAVSAGSGGFSFELCPAEDCRAHAEVDSFELTPTEPNQLAAHGRIILDSRNLMDIRDDWRINIDLGFLGSNHCDIDINTRNGSRDYVGLSALVGLSGDTHDARLGYTKVDIVEAALTDGEGIEDADYELQDCGGGIGLLLEVFQDALKGFISNVLSDQLAGVLTSTLADQLCTTRGDTGCPEGTFAVPDEDPGSTCRYSNSSDAECVPMLLGLEGQGDLGASLLGGFSPGTHGSAQFLLAAQGDAQAINGGLSLSMYGGLRSMTADLTSSPGHNACVPAIEPPALPEVNAITAFQGNVVPGTSTEAHVGIGISEDFLNYAGYGLFDSGMLCIAAGTRLTQQLSTGLISALIHSVADITFPTYGAPLSVALRPQAAPIFEVGAGTEEDPLLTATLPDVEADFYVWSNERYIRIFTYHADLLAKINLGLEDGSIVPDIQSVEASNSTITNSYLLYEEPASLAVILDAVLGGLAGQLSSQIGAIALPDLMGLELNVPDGGLAGVEEDGEEFLGVFANLGIASGSPFTAVPHTSASLESIRFDKKALELETLGEGQLPEVRIHASADGGPRSSQYAYSYRVDGTGWSKWTTDPNLVITHQLFVLQAKHDIEVRSRIVGSKNAIDPNPVHLTAIIDALAPDLVLTAKNDGFEANAYDIVSAHEDLQYRYRIDDGGWSQWSRTLFVQTPDAGNTLEVEARDEAGNVASQRQALIRGLPPPSDGGSSCDCHVPGTSAHSSALPAFVGFIALALGLVIRRRKS